MARLQLLNPHVAVTSDTSDVITKDEAFFALFTLVYVSADVPGQLVRTTLLP